MNRPCLLLEWSDAGDWLNPWTGEPTRLHPITLRIPQGRGPTVMQPSRAVAEAEGRRLARENPGKQFAIFEAVAVATTTQLPSHITLGGQVFAHRTEAVVLAIEHDGQLPA